MTSRGSAPGQPQVVFISSSPTHRGSPHQIMPAIWLAARGFELACLVPDEPGHRIYHTPLAQLSLDGVGALGLAGQARLSLRVLRYRHSAQRPKVFYVHGSPACPAAWLALVGVPRSRVIYHTQDFLEPGRHKHWEFFERRLARRARWVICNDPCRARFMASHYRLRQIPFTVRTALPRDWPVPGRDGSTRARLLQRVGRQDRPGTQLLFHAGPYSPVRCTKELFHAVASLPEDFVLVMTGGDPLRSDGIGGRTLADKLGIRDRVIFLPHLEFDELLRHGAACDVGILLYPNDGVGNFFQAPGRLTEYLRCGLPVVTSAFPSLELLTTRYGIGATCEPSSPQSIRAAVMAVAVQSEREQEARREHLIHLAKGELAFDADAHLIERLVTAAWSGDVQ